MKTPWITVALACLSFPASAQTVSVAGGDWSSIPRIDPTGDTRMSAAAMGEVVNLAEQKACKLKGLNERYIDLTIPFMVQFNPAGAPERIVVARMNCPQLETLMGGVVKQLAQRGVYRPTGENQAGWYRSEISFSQQ